MQSVQSTKLEEPAVAVVDADRLDEAPATTGAETPPSLESPCAGPTVGLALSGGGVRAALFSLGVLVALVQTEVNRCVRCIASVSGGSILNAAVAHAGEFTDYRSVEAAVKQKPAGQAPSFGPIAQRLASSFSATGLLVFNRQNMMQWAVVGARLFAFAAFVGLFFGSSFFVDEEEGRWAWPESLGAVPWPWVAAGLIVVAVVALALTRGRTQRAQYSALIKGTLLGTAPKLGDIRSDRTTHVFVATELLSGKPVYFSKGFVYCEPYGWSRPGKIDTPLAVYASAAFPIAFPPQRLRRARLEFQNGVGTPPFPKRLKLVDGGVYNNLGDDWFDTLQREHQSTLWRYGELELQMPEVDRHIVVNASAPSKPARRTFGFGTVTRVMSVLYDNTVHPRVEQRKERQSTDDTVAVLDIAESPQELVRRLREKGQPNGGKSGSRADPLPPAGDRGAEAPDHDELLCKLDARDQVFWWEFTRQTARTKTKLSKAGIETGARLMLHGYLSCLVLLNLEFGVELPDEVHGERYFLALAGRGAG